MTGIETEEISYERLGSHRLVSGGGRKVCEAVEIKCIFGGDCCWEVQMQKIGGTIKRKNSP